MFGAFWTNGQICSATSRLLLHVWFSESHSSHFMVLDIWYISHSMIFYSNKKLWYANSCPFFFGLTYQHPVVHRWFSYMGFYCNRRELLMSFWRKLAPGHQVLRLVILWRMVVDWALLSVQARYDDLQEKCFLLCFPVNLWRHHLLTSTAMLICRQWVWCSLWLNSTRRCWNL
jgi:hypothetical protein